MSVSIALVHYPVKNKNGNLAATSVTNFDIHDLARTARTYNVECFYIVHPMPSQKEFASRIIRHWSEGFGSQYNPSRKTALEIAKIVEDLSDVVDDYAAEGKRGPVFVGTSAKKFPHTIAFEELRKRIEKQEEHFCLVFGTGWGLHPSLLEELDFMLEPIQGTGDYNHLPVRSAAAIILDRLLGNRQRDKKNDA